MSNFQFLEQNFKPLADTAQGAEKLVHIYPQAAIMCARQSLETLILWLYKYDRKLTQPYDASLYNLLHDQDFKDLVPHYVWDKMEVVRMAGNKAVHGKQFNQINSAEAVKVISQLFLIYIWFERTYGPVSVDRSQPILFMPTLIPNPEQDQIKADKETLQQESKAFEEEYAEKHKALREQEQKLLERTANLEEREAMLAELDAELAKKRAEVEAAKLANSTQPDPTDYKESETRAYKIDLLLAEAGWTTDKDIRVEVPVEGMPIDSSNKTGKGFVDYVLYDLDGLPIGLVEAKRTSIDPERGQEQAKRYADCLEKATGQRPIIFYTNGYKTCLWDDLECPPRQVHGFYTRTELKRLIERRKNNPNLNDFPVNPDIAGRYYQVRAIKALLDTFAQKRRAGLLIMATGTGKTRTAVALVDVLMRANVVQKVLFLADRTPLVKQATNAFKANLPDCSPVNLVEEKNKNGRVYLSTYHTMMGLIDEMNEDGTRKYGQGMFDLIIIDEAHRSVYQKFGEIFKYFDALLVGLTATPRNEVDRDTYKLFSLETGVPTDYYDLENAISDGFLVPPKAYSVPLKFVREGIQYDELSDAEKAHWDSLDWGEDYEESPDEVSASQINKQLFNTDTIDKVLKHLMENGIKTEGGDRLGKTIIFAVNQRHADLIAERFNHNYPHYKGHFARIITHATKHAQSLIDDFSQKDLPEPQIAISVDMLDTGIDVPEVVNLVFFKAVRSKVKFLQMIGRGTRLCPDLFAPGMDKEMFYIFDYCQNFEYFDENPEGAPASLAEPIGQRLFKARVDIVNLLNSASELKEDDKALATTFSESLYFDVCAMNPNNFIVRNELENVEHFQQRENWDQLDDIALATLRENISKLPTEQTNDALEAKLFDMICYNLTLAILNNQGNAQIFYIAKLMEIAAKLEAKSNIPVVQAQIALIQDMQMDDFWQDITLTMINQLRIRIRDLVYLIDKQSSTIVYSMLDDEIGEMSEIAIPSVNSGVNLAQYRKRVESFIKANDSHVTIAKLKKGLPLTSSDLSELEKFVFNAQEVESQDKFKECFGTEQTLPHFIRSLVGLDKQAVQTAFSKYLKGTTYNEKQIRFIEMIIEQLTSLGTLEAGRLYDQPFTNMNPRGVEGIFNLKDADEIFNIVEEFNQLEMA